MSDPKVEQIIFKVKSGEIKTSLLTPKRSDGRLAIVLPGAGYSCRQPLLYYAIRVLLAKNFRVLEVEKVYGEDPNWTKLTTMEAALKVVEEDSHQFFDDVSKRFSSDLHILLGRSLGTYAIACALENKLCHPKKIVWQTPSLNDKWSIIKNCGIDGFAIIGTADSRYQTALPYLPESRIVIEGADHGMEFPEAPLLSIKTLGEVTQATNDWIGH